MNPMGEESTPEELKVVVLVEYLIEQARLPPLVV